MIEKIKMWLRKYGLVGLLLSYLMANVIVYSAIWEIIEPMDIPDRITGVTQIIDNRWLIHFALTQFLAGPLTLAVFWLLIRTEGGIHKELYRMKDRSLKALRSKIQGMQEDLKTSIRESTAFAPRDLKVSTVKEFTEIRVKLRFFEEIAHSCDPNLADFVIRIRNEVNTYGDELIRAIDTTSTDDTTIAGIDKRIIDLEKAIVVFESECEASMRALGYV